MGPVTGPVQVPFAGQMPVIPLAGQSHIVPAGGLAPMGPVTGSAHMGLSTGFDHAVSVRDQGVYSPLTAINGVEPYQVYGDHFSQEHPTS
jgi:hypothetical protein